MATQDEAREVKRRHSARLLGQPGISGVGIEQDDAGEYVLAIHVDANAAAETIAELPERIDNCPVKIIRSGPFRKQPAEE